MIVITGATGQLGRLVIEQLLRTEPADSIVAAVRDTAKAADLAARGVQVRHADYNDPSSLDAAFDGADKLLLVSSNALGGERVGQHRAVLDAASRAGVKLLAYTSILHADSSPLGLAKDHRATEALLKESGLPFVLLRNGWYSENYTATAGAAVQHGVLMGSAKDGRLSTAARADYAAAAAAVLVRDDQADRVHELAGDTAWTLTDLAAELARQSGKPVSYTDMPEAKYKELLISVGLPADIAALLADSHTGASAGALFDDSKTLSGLIGRPTTPIADTVKAALQG